LQLKNLISRGTFWRRIIQYGFLLWCVYIGIMFGIFVQQFRSVGMAAISRPPSVEAFLPIGSLISFRYWLDTGIVHTFHPAGLVLFVTFVVMSLLAKKSFCSFVCPVGTVSERFWKGGERLFGRTWRPYRWIDTSLRSLKYMLLYFFLSITFFKMPAVAIKPFLNSPYWAIADVKMLDFFTGISLLAIIIIAALALLSIPYRNFWCRYLCPYGALVGLASYFSPWKIRRNEKTCIGCGTCGRVCPSYLPVDRKSVVRSVECTGCLTCVSNCPEDKALAMSIPFWNRPLPAWVFPVFVLTVFAIGVGWGMASGHWHTSLTSTDYKTLISMADRIGH